MCSAVPALSPSVPRCRRVPPRAQLHPSARRAGCGSPPGSPARLSLPVSSSGSPLSVSLALGEIRAGGSTGAAAGAPRGSLRGWHPRWLRAARRRHTKPGSAAPGSRGDASRPVPSLPRGAPGSPGMARPGPARLGSARRGSARRGWAGSGQVGALNRAGPAATGASARAPRRPLHVKSPGAGGRRDPDAGGSPSPSPAPAAGRTPSRGAFRPLAPSGPGARLRALASGRRRSPRGSRLACGAVREGGAGTARWAAGAQTGLKTFQCLLLWHSNAHTTPPQGLGLSG